MPNDKFLKQNLQAFKKYGESMTKSLPEYFSDNPAGAINYLRLLGVVCSVCGAKVTSANMKFANYFPEVKCFTHSQK